MAARLAHLPLTAVYSSPLDRTRETAAAIAACHRLPVLVCDGLAEIDFGSWTGRRFDELDADPRWRAWNLLRSRAPLPGGGLMLSVQLRAVTALQTLCAAHPDQTVAVVSHADVVKAAIAYFLGIHLDLFQRLEIAPASVSVVALHPWGPQVIRVNDTGELPAPT